MKILVCFFIFSLSSFSADKDVIKWRVTNWPPFYIMEGASAGEGVYNKLINRFSNDLSSYKHSQVFMNTVRAQFEMKSGSPVCHPSVLKNTDAILSNVNSILLPQALIFNSETVDVDSINDNSSLESILKNPKIIIGVSPNSYNKEINTIVDKYLGRDNVVMLNDYISLIKMLIRGRVDVIIQYPSVVSYIKRTLNLKSRTTNVSIDSPKQDSFVLVYTGCSKSEWGRNVINKINKSLISESKENNFLEERLRWYDKDDQQKLRKLYEKYYFLDK